MNDQKEWEEFIERIKRSGAGEYGSAHFMCIKHEHWKMLWAAERIAELEQQLAELREKHDNFVQYVSDWLDGMFGKEDLPKVIEALQESDDEPV